MGAGGGEQGGGEGRGRPVAGGGCAGGAQCAPWKQDILWMELVRSRGGQREGLPPLSVTILSLLFRLARTIPGSDLRSLCPLSTPPSPAFRPFAGPLPQGHFARRRSSSRRRAFMVGGPRTTHTLVTVMQRLVYVGDRQKGRPQPERGLRRTVRVWLVVANTM